MSEHLERITAAQQAVEGWRIELRRSVMSATDHGYTRSQLAQHMGCTMTTIQRYVNQIRAEREAAAEAQTVEIRDSRR